MSYGDHWLKRVIKLLKVASLFIDRLCLTPQRTKIFDNRVVEGV